MYDVFFRAVCLCLWDSVCEYLHITERISEPRRDQYTYAYLSYMGKFVVTQVIVRAVHAFIYYSCVK